MRVLLVEDDPDLSEVVSTALRREHLAVDRAATVAEAEEHLVATDYDVVCLDLTLPDGDGLDLCRLMQSGELRRPRRLLMLTARDAVTDRVAGLDAGADDYLVKPFTLAELTARVRALSRRDDQRAGAIEVGDIEVDVNAHTASRTGRPLDLTSREFAVLRYLCHRQGEMVSTEELLEHCWDSATDPLNDSVRVILSRLRGKLGDPPVIENRRGIGYRIAAGAPDQ